MTVSRPEGHPTPGPDRITDQQLIRWRDAVARLEQIPKSATDYMDLVEQAVRVTRLCDALLGERAAHTATKAALDGERRWLNSLREECEHAWMSIDIEPPIVYCTRCGKQSGEFGESSE